MLGNKSSQNLIQFKSSDVELGLMSSQDRSEVNTGVKLSQVSNIQYQFKKCQEANLVSSLVSIVKSSFKSSS